MQAVTVRPRLVAYNGLALAIGVAAGLGLVAAVGANVAAAASALLYSPVSRLFNFAEIFVRFIPFALMGLGIALGIRANVWNVGAEGQFVVGSVFAVAGAVYLTAVPAIARVPLMLAAGALGGLLWVVVPAVLRARFGANEIIVTLLFNIVANNFFLYAVDGPIRGPRSAGYPISEQLSVELRMPNLVPETRLSAAIVLTVALIGLLYLLAERTPLGLQIRTVGRNPEAARYAGISIPRMILITLLLSGALSGLAGALHVTGVIFTLDPGYLEQNLGYLSILVAMLGGAGVIGTAAAALVFSYIVVGAESMQALAGVPFGVVLTVEGMILISLTLSHFLLRRRVR